MKRCVPSDHTQTSFMKYCLIPLLQHFNEINSWRKEIVISLNNQMTAYFKSVNRIFKSIITMGSERGSQKEVHDNLQKKRIDRFCIGISKSLRTPDVFAIALYLQLNILTPSSNGLVLVSLICHCCTD